MTRCARPLPTMRVEAIDASSATTLPVPWRSTQ